MKRDEAINLINKNIKNRNLIKHMLAAEAVMKSLAGELDEDSESWGLAGLLHDIDYDMTEKDPESHGLVSINILKEFEVQNDVLQAIKSHNEANGSKRRSLMDYALYASDPLTGLIVASALIHPDKKISSIDVKFVMNRFGEKLFAKSVNREQIKSCASFGFDLERFIATGLKAMQNISSDLGL